MIDKAATSVTINNTCKFIASHAFFDCDGLTSVTIPDSVTAIGCSAFYDCDSLTSVVFADTSTWYRTTNFSDYENQMNGFEESMSAGAQVDVSEAPEAARLLTDNDEGDFSDDYYWFKL